MQNAFSIDGTYYNVRIPQGGIKRSFSVLDDESTTRVASGSMHRSIIGTFYNYTIQLDTSELDTEEYDDLYELISAPIAYHTITVPYGQSTLTFNAYITSGEDTLDTMGTVNNWTGLSMQFTAMSPERT